jgi:hypothetical protein
MKRKGCDLPVLSTSHLAIVVVTLFSLYYKTLPISLTSQATCLGECQWPNSIIEFRHLLLIVTLRGDYVKILTMKIACPFSWLPSP